MAERVLERFVRLCETPSPTGQERAVADLVAAELRELGLEVSEDGVAAAARAGSGNLLTRIPGRSDGWVMFCAHLDTVPHAGTVEVLEEDGVFLSAGDTILGADDKAAVTVLVELAALYASDPPPIGIELLFTVAEEDGLRGASAFDVGQLRSSYGFVFDHAAPIGRVVIASPTHRKLIAEFEGVEAHAGVRPEDGRSAIAAAAAAIDGMTLGRLDSETTANVGVIAGGTATNVVPGRCRVEAETRSLDGERVAAVLSEMIDACTWAAGAHGCDVDIETAELFRGYRASPESESIQIAEAALRRCGHQPERVQIGGGSDANAFIKAGFECLLLSYAGEQNHTSNERIAGRRIIELVDLAEAILAEAAARC